MIKSNSKIFPAQSAPRPGSRLAPVWIVAGLLFSGCAWTPVVHQYPSGLRIVRGDSTLLAQACAGKFWDDGSPRNGKVPAGCWDDANNTIYIRNSCVGAQALIHEWAHKEEIAQPKKEGFSW